MNIHIGVASRALLERRSSDSEATKIAIKADSHLLAVCEERPGPLAITARASLHNITLVTIGANPGCKAKPYRGAVKERGSDIKGGGFKRGVYELRGSDRQRTSAYEFSLQPVLPRAKP